MSWEYPKNLCVAKREIFALLVTTSIFIMIWRERKKKKGFKLELNIINFM